MVRLSGIRRRLSGIVYFPGAQIAERFLYVPAVGLWSIVADQASRFAPATSAAWKYGIIAAALILTVLAGVTVKRNLGLKNNYPLFSRGVEKVPKNSKEHAFLGEALRPQPEGAIADLDRAEKEYLQALALDPSLQTAHTPLGRIRLERGDFEGALYYYSETLALYPLDSQARLGRGQALEQLRRNEEAIADYRSSIAVSGRNDRSLSRAFAEERLQALTR